MTVPSRQLEKQTCILESHSLLETHTLGLLRPRSFYKQANNRRTSSTPPVPLTGAQSESESSWNARVCRGNRLLCSNRFRAKHCPQWRCMRSCGNTARGGEGRLFSLRPAFSWCLQHQARNEAQLSADSPQEVLSAFCMQSRQTTPRKKQKEQSQRQEFKMLRCPCSQKQNNFK